MTLLVWVKEKLDTQTYIHSTTCETCRSLIYTLDRSNDKRLIEAAVVDEGWATLYQCPDCGRYFAAGQRAYKHISEEKARQK
jgi:uncharacterized protein with PIN domain